MIFWGHEVEDESKVVVQKKDQLLVALKLTIIVKWYQRFVRVVESSRSGGEVGADSGRKKSGHYGTPEETRSRSEQE